MNNKWFIVLGQIVSILREGNLLNVFELEIYIFKIEMEFNTPDL
jgi:hypothetical protein